MKDQDLRQLHFGCSELGRRHTLWFIRCCFNYGICVVVAAASLLMGTAGYADGPERPNDVAFRIAGPLDAPPRNAAEAQRSFPKRALATLGFAACSSQIVFTTEFSNTLEAWGREALAKLAFDGDCPDPRVPGIGGTAVARHAAVDQAIARLAIPDNLLLGTTVDPPETFGPETVSRRGDLDSGLKELIAIAYLFKEKLPVSYNHLLDIFAARLTTPNGAPIIGNPPYWIHDIHLIGQIGHASIAESENHTLLELSEQYLANQLLTRERAAADRNRGALHDYLMQVLTGIITTDLFEYNSKPYLRYALYAMENLTDFAQDKDIAESARMVLDLQAAKFASASSLLRRSSPYRRRGSHDGNLFTGSETDEQFCRFLLYTGQVQTIGRPDGYFAPSDCISAVRQIVGSYRLPAAIADLAIDKSTHYVQTYSGGPNYFGKLWGHDVENGVTPFGATELYANSGNVLINGGGNPENNGLPVELSGALVAAGLNLAGFPTLQYSHSDDDVGIALPILFIPNDAPPIPLAPNAARPVIDRTAMVRIEGIGHQDPNLCIAQNFACGKNPIIPGQKPVIGWSFTVLPGSPTAIFIAMLSRSDPFSRYRVGLIEAAPASAFASFQAFQTRVKLNNPQGVNLLHAETDCPLRNWQGHYRKTDNVVLDFVINSPLLPNLSRHCAAKNLEHYGAYPILSASVPLPHPNGIPGADGPITTLTRPQAIIRIQGPLNRSYCELIPTPRSLLSRICINDPNYFQPQTSGGLFQSDWGLQRNFELFVPMGHVVQHYFRDNDEPGTRWHSSPQFGFFARPGVLPPFVSTVRVFQSNFLGNGHGDFEAFARIRPALVTEPERLGEWSFDSRILKWTPEVDVSVDGSAIQGVTGDPAALQSNWGFRGNFELLVPFGPRIQQYFRDNDDPQQHWHHLREFGYPVVRSNELGRTVAGVAFLQSNFSGDGQHGNFEVIARVRPPVATVSDSLDFWFLDSKALKWEGPFPLIADGQPITGGSANPVLLQGTWGRKGNFELFVPDGKIVRTYTRDNDNSALPWHIGPAFGYPTRPDELGPVIREINVIQSNYASDGMHGNFEAVLRVTIPGTQEDRLDLWFFDSFRRVWNGPFTIASNGNLLDR